MSVQINGSDGRIISTHADHSGNVSIGGTLTYEDVTNVDSIGIVTARAGVLVGSGITLSKDGDIFATGVTTATSFSGSGANLTGVLSDVVEDTSPQLGGTLDVNGQYIGFPDSNGTTNQARFGTGDDLKIYHQSNSSYIINSTGNLNIGSNNEVRIKGGSDVAEMMIKCVDNGAVELYHDGTKKFETTSSGADFTVGTGEIDIYSTGSGEKYSLRLLNADASAGNQIGIYFGPANNIAGAYIAGYADEDFTTTANRSASLKFGVRDDGTLKEVGRFTRGGFFQASNTATYDDHSYAAGAHQFHSQQRYYDTVWVANTNANYERSGLRFDMTRSASSAYQFITATSGALSDDEFRARGDGNVYADGSFNPNGADYAEYFEWTDGNSSNEDRRGMTVVLDGNKIKVATSSDSTDNIIGVVSGNASVIGDSSWNKWSGKHLKDDYNQYILDSDGHRQLNPSFDDTKTYVSREDRQEWDAIGMVGKLRIRKGQKTGTRWIKMRDISGDVEEWLVR